VKQYSVTNELNIRKSPTHYILLLRFFDLLRTESLLFISG